MSLWHFEYNEKYQHISRQRDMKIFFSHFPESQQRIVQQWPLSNHRVSNYENYSDWKTTYLGYSPQL